MMKNKLLIGLIVGLGIILTPSCSSFSLATDKASVEVDDKKVDVEGVKIEAKAKAEAPK